MTARTRKRAAPAARSFYADAVRNAEALVEAAEVDGIDEEIALMRVHLHDLLKDEQAEYTLMLRGMELLVRAVATKYRMSPQSADDLGNALGETLRRIADQLFPGAGEV